MQTDTGTQSGLVRGFMEKLAEYPPEMQQLAIARAVRLHPEIAKEFQKAAIGGAGVGAVTELGKAYSGKPTAAIPAGVGKRLNVTPAYAENKLTAPLNAAKEIFLGGPVNDHYTGKVRQTYTPSGNNPHVLTQTDQRINTPAASRQKSYLGSALETGMGAVSGPGAVVYDAGRSLITGKPQVSTMRQVGQNIMALPNKLLGTEVGHNVTPTGGDPNANRVTPGTGLDSGPTAGQPFWGSRVNPAESHPNPQDRVTYGQTQMLAGDQYAKGLQPDSQGGSPAKRVAHNVAGDMITGAETLLPMALVGGTAGALSRTANAARGAATATAPTAGAASKMVQTVADPRITLPFTGVGSAVGRTSEEASRRPGELETPQQPVPEESQTPQQPVPENTSPYNQPYAGLAEQDALTAIDDFVADPVRTTENASSVLAENPAEGQATPANVANPATNSVLAEPPPDPYDPTGDIKAKAQADPETAKAQAELVKTQVSNLVEAPAAKQQLDHVKKTGELTPDATADAVAKLEEQVGDPEAAKSMFENMTTPEKFAVWGGLTIGALGLINAVAGNGGVGSWLATILGLGTAAYAGAGAGLLGEDAQNFTKNINKRVGTEIGDAQAGIRTVSDMGEPQSDGFGSQAIQRMAPLLMSMPEPAVQAMLGKLVQQFPDMATKLDQLTGHGGVVNSGMSFFGNLTGQSNEILKQYGITDPAQQEKLQRAWSAHRAANPRN